MNQLADAPLHLTDDDFTLFALPPRFKLDAAALDAAWRALQSRVHPDRHVGDSPQAQRIAMQWSARVNEAYRRLRDPLKRAAYLCELRGAAIHAETNTAMPLAFLQHQLSWREALDDAVDAHALEALDAQVTSARDALLRQIEQALDVADDAREASSQVRALMFVDKFRDDLAQRRDALADTDA